MASYCQRLNCFTIVLFSIISFKLSKRLLRGERNTFLEEKAAVLCDIKPGYDVLEVGFGPGIGMKKAAEYLEKGKSNARVTPSLKDLQSSLESLRHGN